MTKIYTVNQQSLIKMAARGATDFLYGNGFKYILDNPESLSIVSPSIKTLKDTVFNLYASTKNFFKSIEPYQPLTATLVIVGKAIWKSRMNGQIAKDIGRRENRLRVLKSLHREKIRNCSKRIGELREELQQKKDDLFHSAIATVQLGSLAFPHPGSNVWNSINTLSDRLLSIQGTRFAKAPMTATLGIISAAGTAVSLLKQTNVVNGDSSFCHIILGASFIGMGIETGLMIKNWLLKR